MHGLHYGHALYDDYVVSFNASTGRVAHNTHAMFHMNGRIARIEVTGANIVRQACNAWQPRNVR